VCAVEQQQRQQQEHHHLRERERSEFNEARWTGIMRASRHRLISCPLQQTTAAAAQQQLDTLACQTARKSVYQRRHKPSQQPQVSSIRTALTARNVSVVSTDHSNNKPYGRKTFLRFLYSWHAVVFNGFFIFTTFSYFKKRW